MVVLYVSLTNLWRQLLQNEAFFVMHDLYNYVSDIISLTKKKTTLSKPLTLHI